MNDRERRRVLFTGYAPVHFLCFLPIYQRLAADPSVDVWFSGGFRRKDSERGTTYTVDGFYDPFPVPDDRVLPFEEARRATFDVTVCSHTSDSLWPERPGRTVQIFHGVSFKNFAVREKVLKYDFLCIAGRYHGTQFRERGLIRPDGATCVLTGFPKADRLVEPVDPAERERRLREDGLDPGRPTVLYAPTGGKENSLETIGEDVLKAIDAAGEWNLLVKPHDHPKRKIDWFARLAPLENDRIRLVRALDVVDHLRVADALITDASSVAVEYTLRDRPIVFIEVPRLLENVIERGAPLDLSTYGRKIGKLAKTPEGVVAAVRRGLDNPGAESELRRAMAADVFHDPGGAADRAAEVVRWAAGLRGDAPAGAEVLTP